MPSVDCRVDCSLAWRPLRLGALPTSPPPLPHLQPHIPHYAHLLFALMSRTDASCSRLSRRPFCSLCPLCSRCSLPLLCADLLDSFQPLLTTEPLTNEPLASHHLRARSMVSSWLPAIFVDKAYHVALSVAKATNRAHQSPIVLIIKAHH